MHGDISVESEVGIGSIFTFTMKAFEQEKDQERMDNSNQQKTVKQQNHLEEIEEQSDESSVLII